MTSIQPYSEASESADEHLVCQLLEDIDTEMDSDEGETETTGGPFNLSQKEAREQVEHSGNNMTSQARERVDADNLQPPVTEQHCPESIEVDDDLLRPIEVANRDVSIIPHYNYPPVIYPPVNQCPNEDDRAKRSPQRENTIHQLEIIHFTATRPPGSITDSEDNGREPDGMDDEDNEEATNEEDYESSEISEGGDFQEELQDALDDSRFSFSGNFYHAGLLFSAPNPCLHISGIGIVGLPLSNRDAKAIVSCATLAPFGHGERTVVNKDVRDTWEIEPAKITFANSQWEKYVQDIICSEVCKSLGVNLGNSRPHIELYKLLLYEKGSHFLPHQDTQKADGMFATVIVVLPSAYTGGQVILSHSSKRKTIDFAKDSLVSTALLAWYTDVKHEVKEVTSGYRLALSYNLIHMPSPGAAIPALPDMSDSLVYLRHVLKKWRGDKYDSSSGNGIIAYLLEHEYSPANIKVGIKALKGNDAHKVKHIRLVAEELGFIVGIANLEQHVTGPADGDGGGYYRRSRYDDSEEEDEDEEEDTPGMLEVNSRTTKITGLVDLSDMVFLNVGPIELDEDCLIPPNAFEDETPDDTEYEGYMGNGPGDIEHWFRRTALVLIQESGVDDIYYKAGGVSYGIERLKKSSTIPPTAEDLLWAQRLLRQSTSLNNTHVTTIMDYSLRWKNLSIWKDVMKCPASTLKDFSETILKAWQIFSFENVRLSFEEILAHSTDLKEKITFIYGLPSQSTEADHQAVRAWCQKESDKILSSYNSGNIHDIPGIMTIISAAGLEAFSRTMMPNILKKTGNYAFLLALRKALADGRQSILTRQAKPHFTSPLSVETSQSASMSINAGATSGADLDPNTNPTCALLEKLLKLCFTRAASQWLDTPPAQTQGYPRYGSRPAYTAPTHTKVDRIIEIIELAVSSNEMDILKTLFINILKAPGDTTSKVNQIYTPLIPRLKTSLTQTNRVDIFAPPFIDLLQVIISSYLCDVLGQRGQMMNSSLRKIGCGCPDCQQLDNFITNPTTTTTTIRVIKNRRVHLEQRIASARDICTYETIRSGTPHGVRVTKRPEVVAASSWGQRQRNAVNFLALIGADSVIQRIMGTRYPDVMSALRGSKPFGHVRTVIDTAPTAGHAQMIPSAAGPSRIPRVTASVSVNAPPTAPPAPTAPRLAGTKRKSAPARPLKQLGPVIDLTGDDSL